MKAVIMAGGEGSRLRPLTCGVPKPLVPIANKPVMEYAVEMLSGLGVKDVAVTLQYLPEMVKGYFGQGERWELDLHYYVEEQPLGTAGSVRNAFKFLNETFLVISGDALADIDMRLAMEFHQRRGALATLVLTRVTTPLEYGVVITDPDGKIRRFLEKPGWGEVFSDKVNTGIYILEPQILEHIPPDRPFDFSKELFPALLRRGEALYAVALPGYWCDIGNPTQYLAANYFLLEGKTRLRPGGSGSRELPNDREAGLGDHFCAKPNLLESIGNSATGIYLGQGVKIEPGAVLRPPVAIGSFSHVRAGARIGPHTILGRNTVVEPGADVKRSITWNNVYLGPRIQVRGAVIGERVAVHGGTSIFEGALVGDDSVIEEGAEVRPGVKIWPGKRIGQGSRVHSSVIWGDGYSGCLFTGVKVKGRINVDFQPEVLAKLGAAYGATLAPGNKVIMGRLLDEAGLELVQLALTAGLNSSGVGVVDLGLAPEPLLRFTLGYLNNTQGGIHLNMDSNPGNGQVSIVFMDREGKYLSVAACRKIENNFAREDMRRSSYKAVGRLENLDLREEYQRYLICQVDSSLISNRCWRVGVDYGCWVNEEVYKPVLKRSGCQVFPSPNNELFHEAQNHWDPAPDQRLRRIHQLRELIQNRGLDLGVLLDSGGELVLIDERGSVISPEILDGIFALLVLSSTEKGQGALVVQVGASRTLEELAKRFSARVIRSKNSPADFMECLSKPEVREMQEGNLQFFLHFDPVFATLKLLEFLVRESISLAALVEKMPRFEVVEKVIPCPWEQRGRVMRILAERETLAENSEQVELVDGFKVNHKEGWVLARPDEEKPMYHIRAEAFSQEIAEELSGQLAKKVLALVDEKDEPGLEL